MKSDYDFLHDIVLTIENKMDISKKKHNVEKEMSHLAYIDKISEKSKLQEKDDLTILAYLNLLKKDPPARPRKVHYSKEIIEDKKCFSDELADWFEHIENKLKNGDTITYHLSTGIFDGCRQDVILNTWGITHIHLSNVDVSSKTAMKNRGGSTHLLLCIIKNDDAYLLKVIEHPEKAKDFACIDYLRIIYNNGWMNLIGYEEIDAIKIFPSIETIVNDDNSLYDYISHCNTGFEFDKHFFFPITGVVSTGHNLIDVIAKNNFCSTIRQIMKESVACEYITPKPEDNDLGIIVGRYNHGASYKFIINEDLSIEEVQIK